MKDFYYKSDSEYKVKVMVGDKVKVALYSKDMIYKIKSINMSTWHYNYGTCFVMDETCAEGYYSIPISDLIFIDRDFYDPEHF